MIQNFSGLSLQDKASEFPPLSLNTTTEDFEISTPNMPDYAHLVHHLGLAYKFSLPEPLHERITQVKSARLKIAQQNPNDAENWLLPLTPPIVT